MAKAQTQKTTDTSLVLTDEPRHKLYTRERLALIKPKPEITPTELDIEFMLAMELKHGVHACQQYLRGFDDIPNHTNVIMLPTNYSKHISDFMLDQMVRTGVYFTPNGFKHHTASKDEFLTVKSAFLDIDFPKDVLICTDKRVELTKLVLEEANLPSPTAIIDSGHGLHLYYIFDQEVYDNSRDKTFARMLERIHDEFIRRFNESIIKVTDQTMMADPAAKNANRKLRLPTSWNANRAVHCVEFHSDLYVDFDYLFNEFMPAYDPQKVKRAKEKRTKDKNKSNKVKRFNTLDALNVQRVKDLLTLLKLRQYDMSERRNEFLHIITCQYKLHALIDWEPEIHKINYMLDDPLPRREIDTIIKSAKRRDYSYKSKTIIDKLNITSDELEHMIMNKHTAREVRNEERESKQEQKKHRNEQIHQLHKQGVSKTDIGKQLNISRPTVHKVLKERK